MSEQLSTQEIGQKIRAVATAQIDDFRRLIEIAGLDPARDLRFHNWSGISFAGQNLLGFDFTGARLVQCDFENALIVGARFEQAVLDDRAHRTDLSKAKDWREYQAKWRRSSRPVSDGHLRPGMVFQDAPIAPNMVVIPPGEFSIAMRRGVAPSPRDAIQFTKHIIPRAIAVSERRITEGEYDHSASGGSSGHLRSHQATQTVFMGAPEANAYVDWLRAVTGLPYRLLTTIEWEYCFGKLSYPQPAMESRCKRFALVEDFSVSDWSSEIAEPPVGFVRISNSAAFHVARDLAL